MNGGFGMEKDLMRVYDLQECSLCQRIFLTPQDLTSHSNAVHSTFFSFATAAPTAFRHHPNPNGRNPNPSLPARNRFDLDYGRSVVIDEQVARNTDVLSGEEEKPELMDLFPVMPSEGLRTLQLLRQLEQPIPEGTVTEEGGDTSSFIDLTLRL